MRLGDLDALKEDFKSRLADCNEWIEKAKDKETKIRAGAVKAFIGEVIMTINNAPTVEAIPTELHEKILDKVESELLECQSNLRPQGEWVEAEITEEYRQYGFDLRIVCSRCGSENSYFDFDEDYKPISVTYIRSRFCPDCGARMIKDFTGEAIP